MYPDLTNTFPCIRKSEHKLYIKVKLKLPILYFKKIYLVNNKGNLDIEFQKVKLILKPFLNAARTI